MPYTINDLKKIQEINIPNDPRKLKSAIDSLDRKNALMTLGVTGVLTGGIGTVYNIYKSEDDDSLPNFSMPHIDQVTQSKHIDHLLTKSSSYKEQLVEKGYDLAMQRLEDYIPGITQSPIRYKQDAKGNVLLEGRGKYNPIKGVIDAAQTVEDDPGNHKKKALVAAGVGAGLFALGATRLRDVAAQAAKKDPGLWSRIDPSRNSSKLNKGLRLLRAGLTLGTLGSAYYAANNLDRPERAIGGAAATVAGLAGRGAITKHIYDQRKKINAPSIATAKSLSGAMLPLMGAAALATYTTHELQKADDTEKLQSLLNSRTSENDNAVEINRILEKKDLLTRYPMVRFSPAAEKLREMYNESPRNKPSSEFIRSKIRE